MSQRDPEAERLQRLRDQQIAARDPGKQQERLQRSIASRRSSTSKPVTLGQVWRETPKSLKGLLYGGLLGAAVIIGLPYLLDYAWLDVATLIAFPFFVVLGFFIGRAADTRDRIQEYIR